MLLKKKRSKKHLGFTIVGFKWATFAKKAAKGEAQQPHTPSNGAANKPDGPYCLAEPPTLFLWGGISYVYMFKRCTYTVYVYTRNTYIY